MKEKKKNQVCAHLQNWENKFNLSKVKFQDSWKCLPAFSSWHKIMCGEKVYCCFSALPIILKFPLYSPYYYYHKIFKTTLLYSWKIQFYGVWDFLLYIIHYKTALGVMSATDVHASTGTEQEGSIIHWWQCLYIE